MTIAHDTDLAVLDRLDTSGLAPLHPVLPHVIVFTLPECPNCDRLELRFKKDVPAVAIDLADNPDARALFVDRLGAQSAPVALVHNTFATPQYFLGADIERAKSVIGAIGARLALLETSAQLAVDGGAAFLDHLRANLDAPPRSIAIRPETFARLAEESMPPLRLRTARIGEPAALTADRKNLPPLLS